MPVVRDLVSHLPAHDVHGRGDPLPKGGGEVRYSPVADHLPDFDGTVGVEVFADDVLLLAISYVNLAGLRSSITVERTIVTALVVAVLVFLVTWVVESEFPGA